MEEPVPENIFDDKFVTFRESETKKRRERKKLLAEIHSTSSGSFQGASTFSIMAFSIMALSIMTLSMTVIIMTLKIIILRIITLSIGTLSITTLHNVT